MSKKNDTKVSKKIYTFGLDNYKCMLYNVNNINGGVKMKKVIWLSPETHKELKVMAANLEITMEALIKFLLLEAAKK